LCPAEETIWSKAFVMERERYDGADIAHLIRAAGRQFDWPRLVGRFGSHYRVLLSHLILFGFVYPSERDIIPRHVLAGLLARLEHDESQPVDASSLCHGTLLSRAQYLVDIGPWGLGDPRAAAPSNMAASDIERWTAGIDHEMPTEVCRPTLSQDE
jgi:hypothetical protein